MPDQRILLIGTLIGLIALFSGAKDVIKHNGDKNSSYYIFSVGQIGVGAMLLAAMLLAYLKE